MMVDALASNMKFVRHGALFRKERKSSPGSGKKIHRRLLFLDEMVCDEIDGALHGNSQIRKKTD